MIDFLQLVVVLPSLLQMLVNFTSVGHWSPTVSNSKPSFYPSNWSHLSLLHPHINVERPKNRHSSWFRHLDLTLKRLAYDHALQLRTISPCKRMETFIFYFSEMESHAFYDYNSFSYLSVKIWNYCEFLKNKWREFISSTKGILNISKFSPHVYIIVKNIILTVNKLTFAFYI